MHEAGTWARSLYPSLRSTLVALGERAPSEGLVVETLRMAGLLHDLGKVVLTPHNAADTDPDEISKYVAQQIAQFEASGALENVVDRGRGY